MTEGEIKEVYELWEQGLSVRKIAKATKVDLNEISSVLEQKYYIHSTKDMRAQKPHFPVDDIRELAKTKTTNEIAEFCGLTYATTAYHLKKHGIKPRKDKTGAKVPRSRISDRSKVIYEDIKNANGETLEQIGKKYGVSRQRVQQIKKALEQNQSKDIISG